MKIALITDTHFGVRNDSEVFLNHALGFIENTFLPYLLEHNIKQVIHLGDLFDKRKNINVKTIEAVKERFLKVLDENSIHMDWIIGNHDCYYKSTNDHNSSVLVGEYEYIHPEFHSPVERHHDSLKVLYVPWLSPENYEESMELIKASDAKMVFGHFEINGFEMSRGKKCDHGLAQSELHGFEQVFSGHFHIPGEHRNIRYLGSPWQMDWGDVDSARGFYVLDTKTHDVEFIENPNDMFVLFEYDDKFLDIADIDNPEFDLLSEFKDAFVKIVVDRCHSPETLDYFIKRVEEHAFDVKVIETSVDLTLDDDVEVDATEDTLTTMRKYVDNLEIANKEDVGGLMIDLYKEAVEI